MPVLADLMENSQGANAARVPALAYKPRFQAPGFLNPGDILEAQKLGFLNPREILTTQTSGFLKTRFWNSKNGPFWAPKNGPFLDLL